MDAAAKRPKDRKVPEPATKPPEKPPREGRPGLSEPALMARAGGYEDQRAMLKPPPEIAPMGRNETAGPLYGGGPTPDATEVDAKPAASKFPRKAAIIVLEAAVMSKPQFLGQRVAQLRRGEEITLTGQEGSWYVCVAPNGAKGFIHRNRVDRIEIRLRPGETGSGTSGRNENMTARRG